MAWVSPKVYAILSNSEEGKDIIEKLGEMSQDECDKEVSAFFGEGGKGSASSKDYAKAKEEDASYDNDNYDNEDFDDEEDDDDINSLKDKSLEDGSQEDNDGNEPEEQKTQFSSGYKKPEVKDYSSIKSEKKRLDAIVGDASKFKDNPAYDAYNFRETLENNGFPVDYVENMSGTWQKGKYNEKYKEYDIKLKNSQHIYFRLIADEDYNTKEVIAYQNGRGW